MSGRPTKCTPELAAELARYLRAGNWVETACAMVGISKPLYYMWTQRAEAELEHIAKGGKPRKREAVYVEFLTTVTRARAEAEVASVARIRKAAMSDGNEGDPQQDQWWLERSHPDRWGRRNSTAKVEHAGRVDSDVTFKVELPKPANLDADE